MDKTLSLKLKQFKKALDSLLVAIEAEKSELVRDSVIKRFEYTYELSWKNAKLFLSTKHGVDVFSPKECFRELRRNKLIDDEETEILLQMVDDRNQIIHTYDEGFSDKVYEDIVGRYYELLEAIYKMIEV